MTHPAVDPDEHDPTEDTPPAPTRNGLRQTGRLTRTKGLNPGTSRMATGKPLERRTRLTAKPPTGPSVGRPSLGQSLKTTGGPAAPGKGLARRTPLTATPPTRPTAAHPGMGRAFDTKLGPSATPSKRLERRAPLTAKPPLPGARTPKEWPTRKPSNASPATGSALTRKPAKSDAGEQQPKRIPAQSKKRLAELPERRRIVAAILAIEPTCLAPGCSKPSQDGHERKTRARGGSTLSVTNVVGVCRLHNGELTDEPAWGYETGLLLHSWDDEPTEPLAWLSEDQKAALARVRDERWSPTSPYEVELWYQKRHERQP